MVRMTVKRDLFCTFIIFAYTIVSSAHSRTHSYDQLVLRVAEDIHTLHALETSRYTVFHTEDVDKNTSIEPFLLNSLNDTCFRDLFYVAENIESQAFGSWAWKMLDSYGRLESGFMDGNLKWLGDFNECRNVYAPKQNDSNIGGFYGKYCSLQASYSNLSIPLTVGLCLPETCDPATLLKDYDEFVNFSRIIPALKNVLSKVNITSFSCKANTRQLTKSATATIYVSSVFLFLVWTGTTITYLNYIHEKCNDSEEESDDDDDEDDDVLLVIGDTPTRTQSFAYSAFTQLSRFFRKLNQFLNCFCIFTNGKKLLNTDDVEGQLLSLHGIRFLSMSWVILCHTYAFTFIAVRTFTNVFNLIDNWRFQVVLNGFYSVDSFFVLSGFLTAYLYFKEVAKENSNVSWIYFYTHRYLRLTPVYMIVVGFYATLFSYWGSGPFWPDYDTEPNCQKHWWWNILYINNFLPTSDQCMLWSWYLANDMQFFVISPLFLITLWRWPKIGSTILALFLAATCTASFVLTYQYNLMTGLGNVVAEAANINYFSRWTDYFDKLYDKPYARIGPYLIGIALAYFLFKRQLAQKQIKCIGLCVGWILSTALALTFIYGLYHVEPSLELASFYNALNHTCYAACLSWVIYVCLSGQGGFVNKILSCKIFIPLSRLTYCAYLIHPIVISGYISSLKVTLDFSHQTVVIHFLGMMVVTYAISLIISLVFESPIIRLEKLFRGKF